MIYNYTNYTDRQAEHTLFAITIYSTTQDELQKAAQFYWVRVLSDPDHIREWKVGDLLGQDLRDR